MTMIKSRTGIIMAAVIVIMFAVGIVSAVTPLSVDFINDTSTPTTGVYPHTVSFTATTTGIDITHPLLHPVSYDWSFGGGTGAIEYNTPTTTHIYATPGKYTVTLVVTGHELGESGKVWMSTTKADYIEVFHHPPVASFTASSSEEVGPADITFTSTSTGFRTGYVWYINGASVGTSEVLTYSFPGVGEPTSYTVILRALGDGGQFDNSSPQTITIDPPAPKADFTALTTTIGQKPLAVQFDDQSTGYNITGWDWDFGDGGSAGTDNPVHIYANEGVYDVALTVSGDYGSDSITKTGYVRVLNESTDICPTPPTTVTIYGNPKEITLGDPVYFTADINSVGETEYLWVFSDGHFIPHTGNPTPIPLRDQTFIFEETGLQTGYLIIYDDNGVTSSNVITINVTPASPDDECPVVVNATTGIALFRPASKYWYFDYNLDGVSENSFRFGNSGDQTIAGDWNGDGTDEIALFRSTTGYWYFDNNLDGVVDKYFRYGNYGDIGVAGDWQGTGQDGIALYRPISGYWYFDYDLNGIVDESFRYGNNGDIPVVGNW